jgi:thiol-disulfide isomerase/thioredoxin
MPGTVRVLLGDMTGGLIALVVTLAVATVAGLALRRYSGRFRTVRATPLPAAPGAVGAPAQAEAAATPQLPAAAGAQTAAEARTAAEAPAAAVAGNKTDADVLTGADLGTGLGERATLVQFSTAFCAPCRPTRQVLAGVAGMVDGVRHVEIDATTRLDLVKRLRIVSTPTILVLGPDGVIGKRASGLPRKADVIAALGQVIGPDPSTADLSTNSTGLIDNARNSTPLESGSDSRSETE